GCCRSGPWAGPGRRTCAGRSWGRQSPRQSRVVSSCLWPPWGCGCRGYNHRRRPLGAAAAERQAQHPWTCTPMICTQQFDPMSEESITVRGACPHDCPDTCALLTTVEAGQAVRVQGNPAHRHTDGVLCTKVSRYPERTHHPERVLHPLRRTGPKGSGQFQRIGWDEALDTIATRL